MQAEERPYKTLNFEVQAEIVRAIKKLAIDSNTTATALYQRAISEFLERNTEADNTRPEPGEGKQK